MKSALSLTLVLALMTSALPVAAQGPVTAGPIARSTTREAARFAAAQRNQSPDAEWSRVRQLASGTEITLTVKGSLPGQRNVLAANDSDLTALNLTDPMLPSAAMDVLHDVASNHPNYFLAAQQHGTYVLEKSVRLQPDVVFVSDRKVAVLGQVVENIARNDVAEITTRRKGRGVCGHLGPLGGYFVGPMSVGIVAGFACQAAVERDRCDTGAFLMGALVGGIGGAVYGYHAANRETEDVIYRAP